MSVLSRFRTAPAAPPLAPLPPDLPPGRTLLLSGRGEIFLREADGPRDAPTVVLLHGWTATADLNWFRCYPRLQGIAPVLAPDHRGHGRGMRTVAPFRLEDVADDIAALVRETGSGPAVLVGYSMGGPIALLTAARHPDVAAGLVLAATALEFNAVWYERWQWQFMSVFEYLMRLGRPRGLIERFLRLATTRDPELRAHEAWIRGELRRGDPEMLADAGRALGSYDARATADGIDVPTAVVVTTKDRLVRSRRQRAMAEAIPQARSFDVAADHDAAVVDPAAFIDALELALRDVIERGRAAPGDRRSA